jgi:cytochrome c oxidase subunit 4
MAHAATATHGHDEHTGHGGHHVIAKRDLTRTITILVVLTIVTVVLGLAERYFEAEYGLHIFGPFSVPIALLIAGAKAYFVAAYFMGLKYDTGTNLLAFVGSIIFLIIFLTFTFLDTLFRDTFEEQSAVTVDQIQADALEAARESEAIAPAFEAVPLVNEPDEQLFPSATGSPVGGEMDDATPAIEDGAPPLPDEATE